MTFPDQVKTGGGQTYRLGREIGKGGEGAVFESREKSDLALKLYWPKLASSRGEKISAMVAAGWYRSTPFVAFPVEVLYTPKGAFAGFAMKKVGGYKPVHLLYSPSSRKLQFSSAQFPFLVRSAGNSARAVASVHANSCVIGDVNHSGFLVSEKATITLIDSDSFQVAASGRDFLCAVGTPEYTPPELQGVHFDRVKRTSNHDNFGLAVLVFQMLFMGRHPFSGRFLGPGDMPLERAIKEFRFAYSADRRSTQMEPPPAVPLLSDFPDYIGTAFEKAFGRAGERARPSAEEWVKLLGRLEGELQRCSANEAHHHANGKPCPWCRMESANPGFIAFLSTGGFATGTIQVDLASLTKLLESIADPGPTPGINSIVNPVSPTLPAGTASAAVTKQHGGSIFASVGGLALAFVTSSSVPLGVPGFLLLSMGAVLAFIPRAEAKQAADARRRAQDQWNAAGQSWRNQSGPQNFGDLRSSANSMLAQLRALPVEEARGRANLEQKKRESQLNRHLDRFAIKDARIKKIGSGRKAVLASFGIETAADVEENRIQRIQGFGPGLVSELMTWRRGLEAKFVFNPNEPVNPADITALRLTFAKRKSELESKLKSTIASLQATSTLCRDQRKSLAASANVAFAAFKKAEAEERAVAPVWTKATKATSLVALLFGVIVLGSSPQAPAPRYAQSTPVVRTTSPAPSNSAPYAYIKPATSIPIAPAKASSMTSQSAASSPAPMPPPTAAAAKAPETAPSDAGLDQKTSQWLSTLSPPKQNSAPETVAPPLPPPEEVRTAADAPGTAEAATAVTKRSPTDPAAVKEIQLKLRSWGYFVGFPSGQWDLATRVALTEFRAANGLGQGPLWDAATENKLFGEANGAASAETPIGGWSPDKTSCPGAGEQAPLVLTDTRAESAGGYCEFRNVERADPSTWKVLARCVARGSSWIAHITLTSRSGVLTWVSEKGRAQYFRCE